MSITEVGKSNVYTTTKSETYMGRNFSSTPGDTGLSYLIKHRFVVEETGKRVDLIRPI